MGFAFSNYNPEVVEDLLKVNWTKKHFSKAIWDNSQSLGTALKEEFMVNYLTDGSTDDMARRLAERMNVNYFNARRLVRTESTFVEAEMEARGYEACHIDEYEYVSVLDNRTSNLCRQHDGKIYKVKDRQPGVNYPPLHVFCRATTIAHIPEDYEKELTDEEVREVERMSFEEWKEEMLEVENELQQKGIKETRINLSLIESSDYRNKFDKLNESTEVTRRVYQESKKMLYHRSGTEFEDLSFIHASSAKTLTRNNYNENRTVKPTRKMEEFYQEHPHEIIAIHNHPGSSLPSIPDLVLSYNRKYKYGLIVGHNGSVFKYKALRPNIDVTLYNILIAKWDKKAYNSLEEILTEFSNIGIILEVL